MERIFALIFGLFLFVACNSPVQDVSENSGDQILQSDEQSTPNTTEVDRPVDKIARTGTSEPEWRIFDNGILNFPYPKTFCGTSWQADWDTYSCDQDWEVKEGNGEIGIYPSYSSFGIEFGADISIDIIDEATFQKERKEGNFGVRTFVDNLLIFVSRDEDVNYRIYLVRYGYDFDKEYHFIKITHAGSDNYPEYIDYLIENLKFD